MSTSSNWAPRSSLVAMGWVLSIVFGGLTVWSAFFRNSMGSPGVLLLGIAACALIALSIHGTVVRPRLSANSQGIQLRSLGTRRDFSWEQIRWEIRTTRRLARDVTVLELEHGNEIFVYGWLELGEDPRDVFQALATLK